MESNIDVMDELSERFELACNVLIEKGLTEDDILELSINGVRVMLKDVEDKVELLNAS